MTKKIVLFKSDGRKVQQNVSAFLHQLVERLTQNRIILRRVEEEFVLDIPNILLLELKVEEENAKPLLSTPHSARNLFGHRQSCLIAAGSDE